MTIGETVGLIGAFVLQCIGAIALMRWLDRETKPNGRIGRVIVRLTNRVLDWWFAE